MTKCKVVDFRHRVEKLPEKTFLRETNITIIYVNKVIKR